jgi:hypothetical protein
MKKVKQRVFALCFSLLATTTSLAASEASYLQSVIDLLLTDNIVLKIEGASFDCDNTLESKITYYQVDDSEQDPKLLEVVAQSNPMTIKVETFSGTDPDFGDGAQFFKIKIGDNAAKEDFRLLDCPHDAISGDHGTFKENFISTNGALWQAAYDVTLPLGVDVSDIVLSPK